MSFLDDTYCQLCERFITKEQWNKHLYSSRQLHKKAFGYTPTCFPNKRLIGDEANIMEKAFWKMFFATRDITGSRRVLVGIFCDDNKYGRLFLKRK